MANRTPRSPGGLPSTSPTATSIEDLLNITVNMHPAPTPRTPRLTSAPHTHAIPSRRSHYSPNMHTVHGLSTSPPHHPHDAAVLISPTAASTTRRSSMSNFSPRVVRGTIPGVGRDPPATTSTSSSNRVSTSPVRARRASTAAHPHVGPRTVSGPANSLHTPHLYSHQSSTVPPPSQHATTFPLPEYLEYSAFSHCIASDPERTTSSEESRLGCLHASSSATISRQSISLPGQLDAESDPESSAGSGERGRTATPAVQRTPAETFMLLPTRWNELDRCTSLSVSPDGRELTFHGANISNGDKEAAAARTNHPIPPACGIYYYEVEVLNKGLKGHIGIGFGHRDVKLTRLPGWEKKSWGYHGDDGHAFASDSTGKEYGPKFSTGDIVGCGIDFSTGKAFFTKNGHFIDNVFENIGTDGVDLYPTVGLRTHLEGIRTNFGQDKFKFDIKSHVILARNAMWAKIQSTPVALSGDFLTLGSPSAVPEEEAIQLNKPLNDLVLGYLAHHGYSKTVAALRADCSQRGNTSDSSALTSRNGAEKSSSDEQVDTSVQRDTYRRQSIVHAITGGDIDTALEETRTHYPEVLTRGDGLMLFKLRCRKFMELVLDAAAALRKLKGEEARGKGKEVMSNGSLAPEGVEAMDIDDDESMSGSAANGSSTGRPRAKSSASSLPMAALELAIANGQSLQEDYRNDTRPEVQALFKRTLALVAWDDPLGDDPTIPPWVKDMVSQAARDTLAEEVNRAILESQGRPPHPTLERLYRHTQACIIQLGWAGVGAAAFADMPREFIDA